jgi:hypothetical protein
MLQDTTVLERVMHTREASREQSEGTYMPSLKDRARLLPVASRVSLTRASQRHEISIPKQNHGETVNSLVRDLSNEVDEGAEAIEGAVLIPHMPLLSPIRPTLSLLLCHSNHSQPVNLVRMGSDIANHRLHTLECHLKRATVVLRGHNLSPHMVFILE